MAWSEQFQWAASLSKGMLWAKGLLTLAPKIIPCQCLQPFLKLNLMGSLYAICGWRGVGYNSERLFPQIPREKRCWLLLGGCLFGGTIGTEDSVPCLRPRRGDGKRQRDPWLPTWPFSTLHEATPHPSYSSSLHHNLPLPMPWVSLLPGHKFCEGGNHAHLIYCCILSI